MRPDRLYQWSDIVAFRNIALNPRVLAGKPIIKGTRLTVEYVLNLLAHGATIEDIRLEYPGLTEEDIRACILFATKSLENTAFRMGWTLRSVSALEDRPARRVDAVLYCTYVADQPWPGMGACLTSFNQEIAMPIIR